MSVACQGLGQARHYPRQAAVTVIMPRRLGPLGNKVCVKCNSLGGGGGFKVSKTPVKVDPDYSQ